MSRQTAWSREDADEEAGERAATMLLSHESVGRVVVIGAPGQGKSTLLQIVCQTFRARLGVDEHEGHLLRSFPWGPARLPVEIDLKGYAAFRQNIIRYGSASTESHTLEAYLASVIAAASGGTNFNVEDLQEVASRVPILLALDALDEVANSTERDEIIQEVEAAGSRLAEIATDLSILVTSRPKDAVNNPLLDASVYLHLVLSPLPLSMADDYVVKWLAARGFDVGEHERIATTWRAHRTDTHVRDLTTNLMQVSIVLYIFHRRGESVPRNRTALYAEYVRLLFDREADKDIRVANFRSDLEELHGYLALTLHCRSERDHTSGSLGQGDLRSAIAAFAEATGRESDLLSLFAGVQRVAALVSRVPGRFEFEVQPLREYFAGTYLYQSAPTAPPWADQPTGQRHERALAMLERTFWHNTLRFFAGNYTSGEIASLAEVLEASADLCGPAVGPNARSVALQLLADRVFAAHPTIRQRVVSWAFSEQGCRLLEGNGRVGSARLGEETGLLEMIEEVFSTARLGALDTISRGDLERLLAVSSVADTALPHAIVAIERLPPHLHATALHVASRGELLRALDAQILARFQLLDGVKDKERYDQVGYFADGDAPLWFDPDLSHAAVVHALRHPVASRSLGDTVFSEAQAVVDHLGVRTRDSRRLSRPLRHALDEGLTPILSSARKRRTGLAKLDLIESLAGPDAWLGRALSAHLARRDLARDALESDSTLVALTRQMSRRRHSTAYWEQLNTAPTSADPDLHLAWWSLCVLACAGDTALVNLVHPVNNALEGLTPDRQELVARSLEEIAAVEQLARIDSMPDRPTWPYSVLGPLLLRSRFQARWSTELANIVISVVLGGSSVPVSPSVRSKVATLLWNDPSADVRDKVLAIRDLGVDLDWSPGTVDRSLTEHHALVDDIIRDPRSWPPGLIAVAVGNEQSRGRDPFLKLAMAQEWTNFAI